MPNKSSKLDDVTTINDENRSSQQDAATAASQSGQTRSGYSGYFVTPEDYNFEVSEPKEYFQKELFIKLPLY